MKQFKCNTLVPGCEWHTRDDNDAEIVRRTTEHLRIAHNEQIIRPSIINEIKKRIRDEESA